MKNGVPKHVVIIPDGNRRWARARGWKVWRGHQEAGDYEHVRAIIDEAKRLGVEYLSTWGFSTDNWKRSDAETGAILKVIHGLVIKCREDAHARKIRFLHLGRKDGFSPALRKDLERLVDETKGYGGLKVVLCLDYGGRDDIVRAVNRALERGVKKVTEASFSDYFDMRGIPDPDLIIRTGGEQRLSGFMPYQAIGAELYFTDTYFPDFDADDFREAVEDFSSRKRRHGE